MSSLLPIAILLCALALSSDRLLPRWVERVTGRWAQASGVRYRISNAAFIASCVLFTPIILGRWPFLWQIAFMSWSMLLLLLVAQGLWGTPSAHENPSNLASKMPRSP